MSKALFIFLNINMEQKQARKTIRVFALASFLNDLGSDIIYPIWPLFVTSVLGANMAVLGFLDGLGEALVSISQGFSGYFSDRIRKRKVFIWSGYLCGALSRVGYSLSGTWQHLLPFRILDRAGKIRSAPRDAIVADISTNENRGRHFGILRTMDHLGAVCGIIICILFFKVLGYRNLFLIAAVPSLIGVTLILLFIKEPKAESKIYKGIALSAINRDFKLFLFSACLFSLASFSYSFLLIYAAKSGFRTEFVPVLYLVFTIFAAFFSLPFGKLADRIGRKPVLILSYILWSLVALSFIVVKNGYLATVLVFVLYGLHKAALEPAQKAFASELIPQELRASALGGLQMAIGLCALPASLIAGMLWDKAGYLAPFYFSLSLTVMALAILFLVKETK